MKASRPKAGGSKAIERSIERHIALTEKYVAQGFEYNVACKKAFGDIMDERSNPKQTR
tara:strand:+ start:203 stop:376 length:174 start_codon:yes stop_codon:yes gene_type:complete